jgi:predicted RNA-binding Zn ribbon-like protein
MSTIWADRHGTYDSLATRAGTVRWVDGLHGRLVPGQTPSEPARQQLRHLRDAVRRVAAHLTGDPRERAASPLSDVHSAIDQINTAATLVPVVPVLRLAGDGTVSADRSLTDEGLVAALAASAVDLFSSAEAAALRACLAPGCVLYFIKDHPRREWCSAACGNRARAARHYARHGSIAAG